MHPYIRTLSAALAAALALACHDAVPTAPATREADLVPALGAGTVVSVGAHFFFLPPLAAAPSTTGTFDPSLDPVVEVCAVGAGGGCDGAPVATFTTSGEGSERVRVDVEEEHYIVNWHTNRYSLAPSDVHRITVRVGTTVLGSVDVGTPRLQGQGAKSAATRGSARVAGTIPVKFRIEQGALPPPGKPVWRFNILGAVSKPTADYLGGFDAAARFMRAQIDSLNSRFNTPNVFAGEFRFTLDSIHEYTGTGWEEVVRPHPGFAYKYIVDGFQGPGGWLHEYNVVFLSWPVAQITTPGTTDAIVHEFGHARGAIDLYAIKADGINNPINGASYHAGRSIMEYPYGETLWDQHSINLINRSGAEISAPSNYITEAFPSSIGVSVVDAGGAPLVGVSVRVYPVPWFQNRVDPIPRYMAVTDERGEYVFPHNPFQPGTYGRPWMMVYPNFLVSVSSGPLTGFDWLPVTDVQNAWFGDPAAPYRLRIVAR